MTIVGGSAARHPLRASSLWKSGQAALPSYCLLSAGVDVRQYDDTAVIAILTTAGDMQPIRLH